MPLPELSDSQIAWVIEQVAAHAENQRRAFAPSAVPLNLSQKETMRHFFPASTLDFARVLVLTGDMAGNPPFYGELIKMGFQASSLPNFAVMTAITFVDIVLSREPLTDRVLFHELVHVVQYQKLGIFEFAAKYVQGFLSGGSYGAIPLEVSARELDARFNVAPTLPFSVAAEVQSWIETGRY
jgi:hypothetical protein